eukprot:5436783-Pleurochrysis_carterae.AAC.2
MLPDLKRQLTDRKALVEQCIRDAQSPERVVDALLLETQAATGSTGTSNPISRDFPASEHPTIKEAAIARATRTPEGWNSA